MTASINPNQPARSPARRWSAVLTARHAAIPTEHGSWVFMLVPLTIGLTLGGLRMESGLLALAAMVGFMARQPLTLLVKVLSKRRPRSDLVPALFWMGVYGVAALGAVLALALSGYGYIFYLVPPALPVLGWHLWLVSRRAERKQAVVEIAGSGVLSLAGTAAFWVGQGRYDPTGWLLWALCWGQAAGTILYAYLRLEQRRWKELPSRAESLKAALPAIIYNWTGLVIVGGLAVMNMAHTWLPAAFAIQPLETIWGLLHPAMGVKPTSVGIRQMVISILFAIIFILMW